MITRLRASPPASPFALRPSSWILAGAGVVVVVVLGLLYAGTSTATGLDAAVTSALHGPPQPLYRVALVIDFCGEPVGSALITALLAAVTLWLGLPRTTVLLLAGIGVVVAISTVLKPALGRTIHGSYLSFPSGHTAFAAAVGLVLALALAGRMRLGAIAGTVLLVAVALVAGATMGWAEVALGAHYPTDTLGGFGVGLAVIPLVATAVDRLLDARER